MYFCTIFDLKWFPLNKYICLITFVFLISFGLSAQKNVFQIGDNQKQYDNVIASYPQHLLAVNNNDMDKAFTAWQSILFDLEQYADKQGTDLKGIKLWMNIFVEGNKIDYIYYYPKPISKNTNYDEVTRMLSAFTKTYRVNSDVKGKWSHYGSAAFPVFSQRIGRGDN